MVLLVGNGPGPELFVEMYAGAEQPVATGDDGAFTGILRGSRHVYLDVDSVRGSRSADRDGGIGSAYVQYGGLTGKCPVCPQPLKALDVNEAKGARCVAARAVGASSVVRAVGAFSVVRQ